MKICSTCKKEKELVEFSKDKSRSDGLQNKCKECAKQTDKQSYLNNTEYHREKTKQYRLNNPEYFKQYNKQYRESLKDGLHRVYLLPNEETGYGYIGTTDCIPTRMAIHKNLGNDSSNMMVVRTFEDRDKALEFESFMHDQGYEGRHTKNRYK